MAEKKKVATRDAYGEALVKLGEADPNIVVLDADLSKSTKTAKFAAAFPDRFFNMGIAEQNMMGVAAGLAAAGKTVFASSFAVFATGRAFEQIRNSICYSKQNVKICATHAGVTVGEDGGSHQSVADIAAMRSLPNMTVIVPADGPEAKAAVEAAAKRKGPVYIRLGRLAVPELEGEAGSFKIGRSRILRHGNDVALIGCGMMVSACLEAAELLERSGIQARVINMSTIKPLDIDAVERAAYDCGAIVTAEEHSVIGGLGGAVAEAVSELHPVLLKRIGIADSFGESGKPAELLKKHGLGADQIAGAAKVLFEMKQGKWNNQYLI